MHRAAVFQIAAKPDAQSRKGSLFVAQRHQVGQRLSRVQMPAVPRVDDRHPRIQRRRKCSTGDRMAHRNNIGIAADHPHRVLEGFPFGHRRVGRIVKADDASAKAQHRRLERHLGAGGRLIEQSGQNPPPAGAVIVVEMFADIAGKRRDILPFVRSEIRQID